MIVSKPQGCDDGADTIFDMVQRLYRKCLFNPVDTGTLEDLRRLEVGIGRTFATEEAQMERSKFPDAARHRRQHREIMDSIAQLIARVTEGGRAAFRTEMPSLAILILEHTLKEDRPLTVHLRARHGETGRPLGMVLH